MTLDETSKFFLGWIATIATLAITFYLNFVQANKIKSELLEKFEIAIEKSQKHSATEIFRLIHGLRMSYSEIIELIKHDECSKIIYALKKTPGIVCYENGEFHFSGIGKSPAFQFIDRWSTRLSIPIIGICIPLSFLFFISTKGTVSIAGFIALIFCSITLPFQIKQIKYDQMVSTLVYKKDKNQPQPIAEAMTDDQC